MAKWILKNGVEIPGVCFGTGITWTYRYGDCSAAAKRKYVLNNLLHNRRQLKRDFAFEKAIDCAVESGCTMFDTSRAYGGSEYALGRALKKYPREKFFITTKVNNASQYNDDVRGCFERSMEELGMDYADLYLLHWPVTDKWIDSWKVMEQLYEEGRCRAIGVCNCHEHHLEELKKHAKIMPMVNEFECHPLFTQNALRQYCADNDIRVMAYTSTARNDERMKKTVLVPLAQKYGKTLVQVVLKWHQQIGNIPIVNSSNPAHVKENFELDDFMLTPDEVEAITRCDIGSRLRYHPDNCDFRQL